MNRNTAIRAQHLGKLFRLYPSPRDRLKEALNPFGKRYHTEFHALSDVSFEVKKGEVVGVLGNNGAGKSTLLKIITGVLTPSQGRATVQGRVSSLLELGAGFNPDYSGLENIYLQGTLLGYRREQMAARLDDILAFADIGDFVHQPVKMYSSGMFARLAFAVAINVDPDVLIVDEALSVGDMAFQEKCILRMKSMIRDDRAILFVSHSLPSIRNFCNRAIWLERGRLVMDDVAHKVCDAYAEASQAANRAPVGAPRRAEGGDSTITVLGMELDQAGYRTGDDIEATIRLAFNKPCDDYALGVLLYNAEGRMVTLFNTLRDDLCLTGRPGTVRLCIPDNDLVAGDYSVTVVVSDNQGMFSYDRLDQAAHFRVSPLLSAQKLPVAEGMFRCKHEWEW
ncbi:ABC transporter ATP-binding protein [Oceanisphaera arctica]|uniref:ABC transporter domain-containing protein n=1 Tax=Oceanisphaera arctica TaxID=641510 RepID=A0A2P5TLI8_9GAMM|nr:ABC transporter ATP-binding protein [Oceanisphaera arctica]PPL16172.1 hypothetical protein UN63_10040 [Oceanisphaera arctica]GHA06333.1 ABC transporter ATP-binding protein [Oceanisphaera arctica]